MFLEKNIGKTSKHWFDLIMKGHCVEEEWKLGFAWFELVVASRSTVQFSKRNCARSFLVWKSFIQPANHVAIGLMSQSFLWKIAAWFASSMMDIGKTKLRGFEPTSFYKCTGPHLPPGTTAPIFTRKWNEASWIIRIILSAYSSRNRGLAILTLPPHRPPPLLKFGPLPEINFFGVSDDLEEKKLYKKTFGIRTFFNFFFYQFSFLFLVL